MLSEASVCSWWNILIFWTWLMNVQTHMWRWSMQVCDSSGCVHAMSEGNCFDCFLVSFVSRMNRLIVGEDSQETTTRSSTTWGCWIYFWVCFCSCMGSVSVPCISANLEALQPYTWRDLWDGEPQWCHLPCWAGQLQNEAIELLSIVLGLLITTKSLWQ